MKNVRILFGALVNTFNTLWIYFTVFAGTTILFHQITKLIHVNFKYEGVCGMIIWLVTFIVTLKIKKMIRKALYKVITAHMQKREKNISPEMERTMETFWG